jgi:hypothetical protein
MLLKVNAETEAKWATQGKQTQWRPADFN